MNSEKIGRFYDFLYVLCCTLYFTCSYRTDIEFSVLRGEEMSIDLDTLEATAKVATPGPWNPSPGRALVVSQVDISEPVICNCLSEQFAQAPKDAAFIAAANPTVVLELIAEIRKLRTELEYVSNLHAEVSTALRSREIDIMLADNELMEFMQNQ